MTGRFLPGVPGPEIEAIFNAAAGNEIATGKFDSPESSAAHLGNAFGFFLGQAADLPPLPGCGGETWPARTLKLKAEIRFPWRGGRHPVLDCLVTTPSAVVGIESKRFEPFRGRKESALSAAYWRPVWIATVCGQLETRYRYSNTLGWNTFPVPALTEKNKADLTRCAEDILLAREAHFPATIADLYDAERMPENLRAAHDRNDDVLERIYIGRRFRNDTERLEKLFEMYAKMAGNRTA